MAVGCYAGAAANMGWQSSRGTGSVRQPACAMASALGGARRGPSDWKPDLDGVYQAEEDMMQVQKASDLA